MEGSWGGGEGLTGGGGEVLDVSHLEGELGVALE